MGAGLFAVRGGGHSPVSGAATIQGGVLIVLSLLRDVRPSSDESYASIGAGDKWGDVSRVLDEKGLAVVGGRNSDVGVSGLTLGGKSLGPSSCHALFRSHHFLCQLSPWKRSPVLAIWFSNLP